MALFLVTYDISVSSDADRDTLREELEKDAWAQVSESSYVIQRADCDAHALYSLLISKLSHSPSSLYVFRLSEDFCGSGKDKKVENWINNAHKNFNQA